MSYVVPFLGASLAAASWQGPFAVMSSQGASLKHLLKKVIYRPAALPPTSQDIHCMYVYIYIYIYIYMGIHRYNGDTSLIYVKLC